MVSKYGSPEPVERVPLFGFCHLPLMKSSYCSLILMWSLDSGAGSNAQSTFLVFAMGRS